MTLFLNFPPELPENHSLRDIARKLFLMNGFRAVDSVIEASYVVEFLGSKPTGISDERRIFVFDFLYGIPVIPQKSILVNLREEVVPMFNERGRCVSRIPIRQYLLEFLYKDYVDDTLL